MIEDVFPQKSYPSFKKIISLIKISQASINLIILQISHKLPSIKRSENG